MENSSIGIRGKKTFLYRARNEFDGGSFTHRKGKKEIRIFFLFCPHTTYHHYVFYYRAAGSVNIDVVVLNR